MCCNCPNCDGYEVRGHHVALIGVGPVSALQALMWSHWTDHLSYVEHDAPLDEAPREQFEALGITMVDTDTDTDTDAAADAVAVTSDGTRLTGIRTDDGTTLDVNAIVVGAPVAGRLDGLEGLGLVSRSWDMMGASMGTQLRTDSTGVTEVAGVWAVGKVTDPAAQVITAALREVRATRSGAVD